MKMTSRQRVQAAMDLQQPDRTPLMCQFSIGSMMLQLKPSSPVQFWYDGLTFADGLIELCELSHFDGILISLHGHSPNWKDNIISIKEIESGKQEVLFEDRTEIHSWSELPMVKFHKKRTPICTSDIDIAKDIPSVIDYIPVSQDLHFRLDRDSLLDIFLYIRSKVGDKYSLHADVTSPFDYLLDYLGYENALLSLIMDPDKCKEILQKFTDGLCDLAQKISGCDIDAIKISSPFAGMGFISAEHYTEFVLPYEQQIVKVIRNQGKHVYTHTCGHISDRLELMRETGISGLECLDPEPIGNVDLSDAFSRIGDTLFIKGNIDSVNTLLYADDEKARADVLRIIETGEKNKGFILSTACSIAPKVTLERIRMLSELIDERQKAAHS